LRRLRAGNDGTMLRNVLWAVEVSADKTAVSAPSGPQLGPRTRTQGGSNPFAVAGAAFALGALLAKIVDWRGHAHPKR
jgi:hypothetical protein